MTKKRTKDLLYGELLTKEHIQHIQVPSNYKTFQLEQTWCASLNVQTKFIFHYNNYFHSSDPFCEVLSQAPSPFQSSLSNISLVLMDVLRDGNIKLNSGSPLGKIIFYVFFSFMLPSFVLKKIVKSFCVSSFPQMDIRIVSFFLELD